MESPSPAAPPQQGSNTLKIVLIVGAILAGLCLVACVATVLITGIFGARIVQNVEVSSEDVEQNSASIAEFDLPAGFQPASSIHILGFTIVVYEAPSLDSALVLVQMPVRDDLTDANIRQLQQQLETRYNRNLRNLRVIDEYDATIRGEPGRVIIQEGTNDEGVDFRQMLAVFQGEGGLAMMAVVGPAETWDQAAYDQIIESIR